MTPQRVEFIRGLVEATRVDVREDGTITWHVRNGLLTRHPDGRGHYVVELPKLVVSSIDSGPRMPAFLRELADQVETLQRVVDGWRKCVGVAEAVEVSP